MFLKQNKTLSHIYVHYVQLSKGDNSFTNTQDYLYLKATAAIII